MVKFRGMFGGIGRFKCRLRCKGSVKSVIIDVTCRYFFNKIQCKNIGALNQMINLMLVHSKLKTLNITLDQICISL